MTTHLKHALAFVLGTAYTSAWWIIALVLTEVHPLLAIFAAITTFAGTVGIIALITLFFTTYWKE